MSELNEDETTEALLTRIMMQEAALETLFVNFCSFLGPANTEIVLSHFQSEARKRAPFVGEFDQNSEAHQRRINKNMKLMSALTDGFVRSVRKGLAQGALAKKTA